jgi:hypothetical protein
VQDGAGVLDGLIFAGALVATALAIRVLAGHPPTRFRTARAFALLLALAVAASVAAFGL